MTEQIFTVLEFCGKGDPMFGGNAADWGLYMTEDRSHAFMSAADAQRRDLVKAYFATEKEGKAAGDAASDRNGLISVVPVPLDPRIPVAQLRWIVGNMHVGTSDEELTVDIVARSEGWPLGQYGDYVAQASAYALASHRANQGLCAHFRF
ncbi:hypothetical protein [Agrobacterium vitis]|uniref:Uncharacterized protein n=1 Tax=Agrobacterium vitis TaxID=373 RepID=A0ABW9TP24_AGRVI|nr:hypothetical protein [Agrobacterium vitis]MUO45666.1 hypothetical protein [Agrobacterium vitis]